MRLFVICALSILVLPSALAQTGPPAIVNGVPATNTDFPETVALVTSNASFCTGSLIHPEWVLTAAHCFDEPLGTVEVAWGTTQESADRIGVDQVIVHPTYIRIDDAADGRPHDDIALIKLATARENAQVMSLNPDPVQDTWLGLDVTFSGFGITASEGSGGGVKRYADVPISGFDDETLFTFDGFHSTCQGDSGGPGVLRKGNGYVQVGITSYGVECGAGDSGATRVDAFLPWIEAQGIDVRTTPAAPPTFTCSHQVSEGEAVGLVPFELNCVVEYPTPSEIIDVSWLFGDGGTGDGLAASHTYLEQGQYTVQACVEGETDGFRWEHCAYEPAYVRACGVPEPVFEIAASELAHQPLTFDFVNRTDTSTFGCLGDVQWDIFAGNETRGRPVATLGSGWSPRFTFPEPGEYTIQLHLGGFGGTGAAVATVDTRTAKAAGCATVPGGGGLLLALVLLAAPTRSRGRGPQRSANDIGPAA